ncbi:MAG TPA: hypothetical protein VGF98_09210 [Candidatus Tumulicola sp.]|jgi:hypothetical protein
MMTEQLRVSVVAAPLAAIDPRVLSQAWYSALHVARTTPNRPMPAQSNREPSANVGRPFVCVAARDLRQNRVVASPRPRGVTQSIGANDVRSDRTPSRMAHRIERALARPQRPPRCAAFVVGEGVARALIVLQSRGDKTYLVAMCAPERRETVVRALAQVRASLAARGLAFESRVQAGPACS